jgi:cytochrome c-type biogenesis protein CcmH/NrfG
MDFRRAARAALAGVLAAALVSLPAPADAQSARGGLGGKIVDSAGKPVPDAEVVLEAPDVNLKYVVKTNSRGEWSQGGMPVGNRMNITAKKGDAVGGIKGVPVRQGSVVEIPDIMIVAAGPVVSPEEAARIAAEKAMEAELAKMAAELEAAIAANDLDLAITKFTEAAAKIPQCATCYVRIGELHMKKARLDDAEKAYLQAIAFDPTEADAYSALVNIYNQQKKYEAAAKMNEKVTALAATAGGGGGGGAGGNAEASYNQGALLFNQNKILDAKPHLLKAIELKPDLAEAHYLLGMVLINENKLPEAKKSLSEYLKLAPTGPNAATAKAIVDSMP